MPDGAKKFNLNNRPGHKEPVRQAKVGYDNKRGTAHQRGYTAKWQAASKLYLSDNPLCAVCDEAGHTEAATCVDHIIPHRGNDELFWDEANWQPMCTPCHTRKTRKGQ